jgi:hypothetical protein
MGYAHDVQAASRYSVLVTGTVPPIQKAQAVHRKVPQFKRLFFFRSGIS